MNTNLLTTITYGLKRGFKKFRKNLTMDFKYGKRHTHKNMHAMPLYLKQKLLNVCNINYQRNKKEETGIKFVKSKGTV
jgi:hypothetical protein